ncbi:class I SAM-dependent methyltransferase [Candidatus Chloroploca sp. M-50]|uniref:Class I SAM-dependent methyltransferase n=1 Tax=Candidatus Chloroploca mongolica TaxID=2528176 RepID=A0ABS4DCY2_9CHLR|nr:class I SAM-dependent methyltransferase [Candidatus Chloroploca mongolica]MBP1467306.1 class I SAM-dependent methyltransferase [Candidatus Chloroploca mongolica]
MKEEPIRFRFGSNWQSYVATALSPGRIEHAVASLQLMLNTTSLQGRTFLDIGCGSGLFSLAACRLGAVEVASFDYDADAVRTSLALREQMGIAPEQWSIRQGSVLDATFMATLAPADVVYAWGVLHHTGAMWQAIASTAAKVAPGGLFALAIYNEVRSQLVGSARWRAIKLFYNQVDPPVRRVLELGYASAFLLKDAAAMRNPLTTIRRYNSDEERGMDFWHDLRDWIGGYPYEYATAGEVFTRLRHDYGFQLEYLKTLDGLGCNEFTFRRSSTT